MALIIKFLFVSPEVPPWQPKVTSNSQNQIEKRSWVKVRSLLIIKLSNTVLMVKEIIYIFDIFLRDKFPYSYSNLHA